MGGGGQGRHRPDRGRLEYGPGYGYGYPGYDSPPRHKRPPFDGPPSTRTGRTPGRGGFRWAQDEINLWDPVCVKSDYLIGKF